MNWDHSVDVVIVGSGNSALTNALCNYEMGTRDVLVIEKTAQYGGTSAIGGGGVWIPCNHYAMEAGAQDTLDDAMTYLENTIPEGAVPREMLQALLENGPKMLKFLADRTQAKYISLGEYPDYYSDQPGARLGHRSVEPEPLDITELSQGGGQLRSGHQMMLMMGMVPITQQEAHIFTVQSKGWVGLAMKLIFGHLLDLPRRLKRLRSRRSTCGQAGVARLALSVEERNIPIWLNTEMTDLVMEDGRVAGIRVNKDGREMTIQGRKGVVLASGGFERNQAMREQYLAQADQCRVELGQRRQYRAADRKGGCPGRRNPRYGRRLVVYHDQGSRRRPAPAVHNGKVISRQRGRQPPGQARRQRIHELPEVRAGMF